MRLIFVDKNPEVVKMLRTIFPQCEAQVGDLDQVPLGSYDVLFTPGNSYGLMDGGFDLAVRNRFPDSEKLVQKCISEEYGGMLPVGAAVAVTFTPSPIQLVYAPTMQVPMQIVGTNNIYLAFLAACRQVKKFPNSGGLTVLSSGFGTEAGGMPYLCAAQQMRMAYEHSKQQMHITQWYDAYAHYNSIKQWS